MSSGPTCWWEGCRGRRVRESLQAAESGEECAALRSPGLVALKEGSTSVPTRPSTRPARGDAGRHVCTLSQQQRVPGRGAVHCPLPQAPTGSQGIHGKGGRGSADAPIARPLSSGGPLTVATLIPGSQDRPSGPAAPSRFPSSPLGRKACGLPPAGCRGSRRDTRHGAVCSTLSGDHAVLWIPGSAQRRGGHMNAASGLLDTC